MRRTWPQRLLISFNIFLIGVSLVTAGGLYYAYDKLGQLPRVELSHVLSPAPAKVDGVAQAQNFLLVGSDSRAGSDPNSPDFGGIGSATDVTGQRSDTIMVLRIDPNSSRAALLSLPRDLWVPIAGTGGKQRINTAFSRGPDVLIQTLQQDFGIPIQHYVEVDFVGFKGLVDAVGGVPVYFSAPARDKNTGLNITAPGCITLTGTQALAYARSRHYEYLEGGKWRTDGTGDLGRISRQQDFIRRSMKQAVAKGVRNPVVLNDLIDVGTKYVTVDSNLTPGDLLGLGNRFRSLDPGKIDMYTVPTTGTMINGASVLLLQDKAAQPVLDVFRGVAASSPAVAAGSDGTGGSTGAKPSPVKIVNPASVQVRVLNGTSTQGLAGRTSDDLSAIQFNVTGTGDADRQNYTRTTIRYAPGQESAARTLAAHLVSGAELDPVSSINSATVILVVGKDFAGVAADATSGGTPVATTMPTTVAAPPTSAPIGIAPAAEAACG